MLVPDEIRKCVGFLMYMDNKSNLQFAGTAFFVGVESGFTNFIYLVTAKHVIVAIREKGTDGKVYIRMNDNKDGSLIVPSEAKIWQDHPDDSSVDASILKWAPDTDIFDYKIIPEQIFATEEKIKQDSVGVGDEVFMPGLFVSHFGKAKNIPIVRIGNIASMPEEKVDTRYFGSIDAYLIEARSIGGLSGSPVFVHLSGVRSVGGNATIRTGGFYLLGLMHGHWDREKDALDVAAQDGMDGGTVNMGIGMVVPATKILEIINQPKWVEERQAYMDKEKEKKLPVQDSAQYQNTPKSNEPPG